MPQKRCRRWSVVGGEQWDRLVHFPVPVLSSLPSFSKGENGTWTTEHSRLQVLTSNIFGPSTQTQFSISIFSPIPSSSPFHSSLFFLPSSPPPPPSLPPSLSLQIMHAHMSDDRERLADWLLLLFSSSALFALPYFPARQMIRAWIFSILK